MNNATLLLNPVFKASHKASKGSSNWRNQKFRYEEGQKFNPGLLDASVSWFQRGHGVSLHYFLLPKWF